MLGKKSTGKEKKVSLKNIEMDDGQALMFM